MSNQVTAPPSGSGQSSVEGRLDSWKEIAAYLRREVRTVQRWEKSANLPVHRLQIEKQSAIYAYKSELDAWHKDRRPQLEFDAEDSERKETPTLFERLRQPRIAGAVAALILILSGGAYFVGRSPWFRAHSLPAKIKLAVLPFKNLSADLEQEYFSDGMTEEMITELGRMQPERLGVIARTSAMLYKNTQKDLSQICRELGVQYVLEGSVFRAGNRARITAQLIQCSDQTHIWADSSERDLINIVSLQGDVAQAVAKNIRLVLTPEQHTRLRARRPVNPEAYQAYLRGLYLWNQVSADLPQMIKYFQAAIEIEPDYASAYAGLASAYSQAARAGQLGAQEAYAQAKAAATRAAALDDNSAEAHFSLANVVERDWDWSLAEREYRRAIELDPNLALAHLGYGYMLVLLRRPDEAWSELKTAQALDPISQVVGQTLAISLYDSRRYDEAFALAKQWLELYPDSVAFHAWIGEVYAQKGMEPLAAAEYLKVEELGGSSPSRIAALQNASRKSGLRGFWRTKIALDEEPTSPRFTAYDVAYDYAVVGDRDHSLRWLEKAYAERDWRLIEVAVEPRFDPLRSDPRFQDLLRRLNLPQ